MKKTIKQTAILEFRIPDFPKEIITNSLPLVIEYISEDTIKEIFDVMLENALEYRRSKHQASPLVKDFVNKHGEELMKDLPGRKDMVDYADLVHDGLKSVEQKIAKKAGEILANKIG